MASRVRGRVRVVEPANGIRATVKAAWKRKEKRISFIGISMFSIGS